MTTPLRRRDLLKTLGVTFAGVGLGAGATGAASADAASGSVTAKRAAATASTAGSMPDWTQYQRDPANTGYAPNATGPTSRPSEAWSVTTDDFVTTPVVDDGVAFFPSNDGHVYAVDAATGERVWRSDSLGDFLGPIGAMDGRVFVDVDRELRALDADNGSVLWRFDDVGLNTSWPTLVEGTVYAGSGQTLHAIDAETGDSKWSFDEPEHRVGTPAVDDGRVYLAPGPSGILSAGEYVYALDTTDGSVLWRFDIPPDGTDGRESGEGAGTPTVAGDTVLVPCTTDPTDIEDITNPLYALDSADGSVRWVNETGTNLGGRVTVSTELDLAYTLIGGGTFHALSTTDGTEAWSFEVSDNFLRGSVVAGDTVYVGNSNGNVYALDARNGDERWRYETSMNTPGVGPVGGRTILVEGDETVLALTDAETDPATVCVEPTEVRVDGTAEACVTLGGFEEGFAGCDLVVSFPGIVRPEAVDLNAAFGIREATIDGQDVRIRVSDTNDTLEGTLDEIRLGCVTLRGVAEGEGSATVSPNQVDNDAGAAVELVAAQGCGTITCLPERACPTVDGTDTTDPDGDGLCEDFNGNGRLDFDDVNRFFENVSDSEVETNVAAFDFNGNDRIDFDDVNTLFDEVS